MKVCWQGLSLAICKEIFKKDLIVLLDYVKEMSYYIYACMETSD